MTRTLHQMLNDIDEALAATATLIIYMNPEDLDDCELLCNISKDVARLRSKVIRKMETALDAAAKIAQNWSADE